MTNYTFSVVATNSIGSGEAGVVMITTSGKATCREKVILYLRISNECTHYVIIFDWLHGIAFLSMVDTGSVILPSVLAIGIIMF